MLQLFKVHRLDLVDHGQHRGLLRQLPHKALQLAALTLQLQLHAGGGVFYVAAQAAALYQLVDEGPEPDPLYNSADVNPDALQVLTISLS